MLSYSRTKTSDRLVWRNSLHVLPRNMGRNAFIGYGTTMLRPDGHPVKAEREPVLDMETWETLKAVLALPKREISAGRIDRQYMLVGFLRCKGGAKSSQVTSTIAGVECVVGTPQVGTGIGAAATAFCVSLAARCTGISAS